ncbi:MAG: PilN domain-containing protein [Gammaproteobacteria bacterium]|nr:PilN domain-containing protein [Gammaproteobacteria bacterium]
MTHINLLPWREIQRKERERQFYSLLTATAILMAVIVFYMHLHFNGKIEEQTQRNNYIEQQITLVDKKIKEIRTLESEKENLLARMNIIQDLQGRRPLIVHLFDELVKTLPKGVSLTSIAQKGTIVTLKGIAQSNASISIFMGELDASAWLSNPRLDVIEANQKVGRRAAEFTMRVDLISHNNASKQED